jgi:hypothetical protein
VYTVEEVDLLRLEKHITVWKVDLEESRGGNRKLEMLLAQRLMRESVLLMKTLRTYAGDAVYVDRSETRVVPDRRRTPPPPPLQKSHLPTSGGPRREMRGRWRRDFGLGVRF